MLTIPNRVLVGFAIGALVFTLLAMNVETNRLIVILNGVFFGASAALVVAYWRLVLNAFLGIMPYNRVRQMTLGWALGWTVIVGSAWQSVFFRASGMPPSPENVTIMTAVWRALGIGAAILQVTAPDFGLGIFHGRDRKTLWTGIAVGLVVAAFMIFAQREEILEPWAKAWSFSTFDVAFATHTI